LQDFVAQNGECPLGHSFAYAASDGLANRGARVPGIRVFAHAGKQIQEQVPLLSTKDAVVLKQLFQEAV
jgi:hypothetical protein